MILEILISVIAGFLFGLIIAKLGWDEIVKIRFWLRWLFVVGVLLGIWMFLIGKQVEGYVSLFVGILGLVGYWKSWNKGWTRKG